MSNGTKPLASFTADLDSMACYRAIHGLPTTTSTAADSAYTIGVERMLRFLDEQGVLGTLFVIGSDAELKDHEAILRRAFDAGHELASHSYSHDYALRCLPDDLLLQDFERVETILENITGARPVGFRAPGYNIDSRLLKMCSERGYLYDSSVFPCPAYYAAKGVVMGWLSLRGTPSRSSMTRAEALIAPIHPYHPAHGRFWARGDCPILEIPMAVVPFTRFPVIGTSLHILGEKGFDVAFAFLKRSHTFLNLEFHAIDFMDDKDPGTHDLKRHQPDLAIPWTTKKILYSHVFERIRSTYDFCRLDTLAKVARSE